MNYNYNAWGKPLTHFAAATKTIAPHQQQQVHTSSMLASAPNLIGKSCAEKALLIVLQRWMQPEDIDWNLNDYDTREKKLQTNIHNDSYMYYLPPKKKRGRRGNHFLAQYDFQLEPPSKVWGWFSESSHIATLDSLYDILDIEQPDDDYYVSMNNIRISPS